MSKQFDFFDTLAEGLTVHPIARPTDPPTSHAAASEVPINSLHRKFLWGLKKVGHGTASEIAEASGHKPAESVRKRAKELLDAGLIVECGTRRCGVTGKVARVFGRA